MIEWREAYAIGEENIDRHHRELFKAINRIERQTEPSEMVTRFEGTLHFLDQYARLHFAYEEARMKDYRCASAERNYQAHQDFLTAVSAFREQYRQHGYSPALAKEVNTFCEQWITNHICTIDIQLKNVLPRPEDR